MQEGWRKMSLQCLVNKGGKGKGQAWDEQEKEAGRSASTTLLGRTDPAPQTRPLKGTQKVHGKKQK